MHACGCALSGNGDHRSAVHVRVGHPRDEIGGARAKRRKTKSRFSCKPAINIGHERRALFVASGDEPNRTLQKRVQDIDILFARNAEDVFNALVFQAFDEQFSRLH